MPICPEGHDSRTEDWCDFCGRAMTPGPGQGLPVGAAYGTPPPPPMPPQQLPGATEGLVTCPICRTPQTGRYCEECGYDYELASPMMPQHHQQPVQQQHQQQAQHQPGYGYPPPQGPGQPAQNPGYGYPPPMPPPQVPQVQNGYGQPVAPPLGNPEQEKTSYYLPQPEQQLGQQHGQQLGQQQGQQQGQQHGQPEAPAPVRTHWIAVVNADRDYFTDMMARSGPEAAGLFFPPYCPERRIPITGRGQVRIGRRSQQNGTVPEIDLSVPPEDPGVSHKHALLAEQPDGSWVLVDLDSTNRTTLNGSAEEITPHTAIPMNDGDRIHVGAWTTITLHRA